MIKYLQNTNPYRMIKTISRRIKILARLWWYQGAFDTNMSRSDVNWFFSKGFVISHVTESCYSIGFTGNQINWHEYYR